MVKLNKCLWIHTCVKSVTHTLNTSEAVITQMMNYCATMSACDTVNVSINISRQRRPSNLSLIRDVPQTTWVFSCALYSAQCLCNKCSDRNQLATGQIYALLNTAHFLAKKTEDHKCKICSVIYKFLHSVKQSHKNLTLWNWNWQLISNISPATIRSMHHDSKGHKNIIPNA